MIRMMSTTRTAVVLAALVLFAIASNPTAQTKDAETAIREGVQALVNAYGTNDKTYFGIHATDMTVLRPEGGWTHQAYNDRWTQVVNGGGGNSTAKVDDLKIQMLPGDDAAVATFLMPVDRRFPNAEAAKGQPAFILYNMSTVWAKRNGQWNIVHAHWSRQAEKR